MDRLTCRNPDGGISVEGMTAALEKLAALEDMQEQKRLIELPVKPGQMVYVICNFPSHLSWIANAIVQSATYEVYSDFCRWEIHANDTDCRGDIMPRSYVDFHDNDIGKTVFLTRAEAETVVKALIEKVLEAQHGA